MPNLTRPTNIPDMVNMLKAFLSEEGVAQGLAFEPGPSDVFIATYPKCGTTWAQQIFHGLRTGGSMDFEEISIAVPWIEAASDMGIDLNAPQAAQPRGFKTHLSWDEVPKGARYIYVMRNPNDVLVSYYRFFEGWFFEPGSIDIETFTFDYLLVGARNRNYWTHLLSWWDQRHADNTVLLCFENMKRDLPGHVERIAAFAGIDATPELRTLVSRQAEIGFMQQHISQFDDHVLRDLRNPVLGLPPGGNSDKVRDGQVGQHKRALPDTVVQEMAARWQRNIAAPLGYENYHALRAALQRGE